MSELLKLTMALGIVQIEAALCSVIIHQVKEMAVSIKTGLIVMACGSYRRGKQTCGDVDILITHPDGHSHCGVYTELINRLTATGIYRFIILVYLAGNSSIRFPPV